MHRHRGAGARPDHTVHRSCSGCWSLVDIGNWLVACATIAFFWATGLWRAGVAPTMQAPATLLPGRTRQVLRGAWAGLLIGEIGRATGLLSSDAATHALTSIYLVPLILLVGIRMLPRVSAYPIRFPKLCGLLVWTGLLGGVLRAFGGLLGVPGRVAACLARREYGDARRPDLRGPRLVTVGRANGRPA